MPKVKLFDENKVLEKAMQLFWANGYYHTSVQDLVDHLGISRSSLYDTFGGKKKLFHAAFELYRSSNQEGLRNFLSTQENVHEALRVAFLKVLEDDTEDADCKGCFIVNTTTELLPVDSLMQDVITEHKKAMEQIFYDFLLKGVASGQVEKDKDLSAIASLLYTVMTGLRVLGKTNPPLEESMASVDAVLSLI